MKKRYLIGQIACFGDCLLATTLAKQLKHDNPENHITWAVAAKYRSVLDHNPYVDEIWELPIYTRNISKSDWANFITQAEQKKAQHVFDELLYTQIFDDYIDIFFTTLRYTVFKIFNRPVTVDKAPVISLTAAEIDRVSAFAQKHRLTQYKEVVLFECAPTSEQSKLNIDFAARIANELTKNNKEVCFILTTSEKLAVQNEQIIDASVLSFRENAELAGYCTLLIGCSSGITWLCTSSYSKKLPTIQLLNERSAIFAGVNFDLAINGLDNSHVIEMTDYDFDRVMQCIQAVWSNGAHASRPAFNQDYKPNQYTLEALSKSLLQKGRTPGQVWRFMKGYLAENKRLGNIIRINKPIYLLKLLFWNFQNSQNGLYRKLTAPWRTFTRVFNNSQVLTARKNQH